LSASLASAAEVSKSKIEELFIWKMSDELSLSPQEEKKFSDLVRGLNEKKGGLSLQLHDQLEQMQKAKTETEKGQILGRYKKTLQSYNHLAEEELDKMKSLLGVNRTVKYLEVKQDMTNRLKSLLINPEGAPKGPVAPLPEPKVIEE
jgi:hypothetical protein